MTKDDRERKAMGIVTEQDLVRRILTEEGDMSGTKVKSIMSSPLMVTSSDATIEDQILWHSILTQSSMPWQG